MHLPLIPIKRRNEIVAHCRPLAVVPLVAVRAWHTGAAAALILPAAPRLVRMVLAHPASILTSLALDLWLDRGAAADRAKTHPEWIPSRRWPR